MLTETKTRVTRCYSEYSEAKKATSGDAVHETQECLNRKKRASPAITATPGKRLQAMLCTKHKHARTESRCFRVFSINPQMLPPLHQANHVHKQAFTQATALKWRPVHRCGYEPKSVIRTNKESCEQPR